MIDCFPFFNELDVLEVRLNALAPHVDRFVLAECAKTHSGNPKPLFFEENKDRFKEFNITHIIIPPINGTPWELEEYGREYLLDSVKDGDPEEIILISDLDEIPNLENYKGEEGKFKQYLYYYYFNCFTGIKKWMGTFVIKRKNIDRNCIEYKLRINYKKILQVVGDGWHFSTMGSTKQIIYKLESLAHQELNTTEYKSKIDDNRRNLVGGRNKQFSIQMPSGPKWLLENKERYPDLWTK